jgi:hypothetical protein
LKCEQNRTAAERWKFDVHITKVHRQRTPRAGRPPPMAFKDPRANSNPVDQTGLSRSCDKCTSEMTHLGNLPSLLGKAVMSVFRCYVCNHVVSEDWQVD